ncbi:MULTISPECIES: hypothetical protein [Nostoc]|uniref:hypothetical protein n=1 Tax=Nostoc TaxID=1177 RepID=UPI0036F40B67
MPKDFNLQQYLETIRERYGNLKLDSLECLIFPEKILNFLAYVINIVSKQIFTALPPVG